MPSWSPPRLGLIKFRQPLVDLEFIEALLDRRSKEKDLFRISLAKASLAHGPEIEDLLGVETHDLGRDGIGRQRIGAGQRDLSFKRRSPGRAVPFHGLKPVDDRQAGPDLVSQMKEVEMEDVIDGRGGGVENPLG